MTYEARFWEPRSDGHVSCRLCHKGCYIAPGDVGACGVRKNDRGKLTLPHYGKVSSSAVDYVEKKPLYHYHPGSRVFSLGFTGCNLSCPFCQNWTISQVPDAHSSFMPPGKAVQEARMAGCSLIAYTYSEPLIHAEYLLDCTRAAHAEGLGNILVTNGHALEAPAIEILRLTDAANVDVKTWDPAWYRAELGGDLGTVRRFLEIASTCTHLEVTTLIIPGRNDDPDMVRGIAAFLADLSPNIPLHLSAYRPMYRYTLPPTPRGTLERLA
ncbi:MAG TPA: AmmeMemoRadiSam system radical SAM enzyme, partial [Magnetospirillaceae bacterium]|nr:AmmeMemoRadiSam system radical SAM enzyme [Magnetospirillaceae bacterium]